VKSSTVLGVSRAKKVLLAAPKADGLKNQGNRKNRMLNTCTLVVRHQAQMQTTWFHWVAHRSNSQNADFSETFDSTA
jgi:hypothetical protein